MSDSKKKAVTAFIGFNFLWIFNLQIFHLTALRPLAWLQWIQGIQAIFLLLIQVCLYAMLKEDRLPWIDEFQFTLLFLIVFSGYFSAAVFFTLIGVLIYYTLLRQWKRRRSLNGEENQADQERPF